MMTEFIEYEAPENYVCYTVQFTILSSPLHLLETKGLPLRLSVP